MEYLKFWLSKGIADVLIVLAFLVVLVMILVLLITLKKGDK